MKKRSLLILVVLGIFILSGCASASRSYEMAAATQSTSNFYTSEDGSYLFEAPAAASDVLSVETEYSAKAGAVADATVSTTTEQMIIKNASLSILVDDPSQALSDIMSLASEMGGYTVSSNSYQTYSSSGNSYVEAYITIRVPAASLDNALKEIKAMTGNAEKYVTNESVSGQDVTKEYTDLQSRLRNLEEAEVELSAMYDKATDADDILAIYQQKMQVTEQIEVIKGQMQYYEQAAAMSAISVQISSKASVEPVTIGGWEPKGVARDAVQALINFLKGLVNFLIWLAIYVLPILIIIGTPLFFFIRWLVRRNRRKQEELKKMPPMPVEKK